MVVARRLELGLWVALVAGSLAGTQGCVFDGDASLGSADAVAGNAGAYQGGSGGGGNASAGTGAKASAGGVGAAGSGATGGQSKGGNPPSEAGAPSSVGGESGSAGAPSGGEICALPIDPGDCDGAIPRFAFDASSGKCESFVYGGCQGNANRFVTLASCQAACEALDCPSHLQTDKVYEVLPLNRPERACVDFEREMVVSCSMLLPPGEVVPTDFGAQFCVKRDDQLYYAGTTLPKADGWQDCSAIEAELVAEAPPCADL